MLNGKRKNDTLRRIASTRHGGFAGNLVRLTLAVVLALSMTFSWGMLAFADELVASAQEEATESVSAGNTGNTGTNSDAPAQEARNDLLLPTILAIAGIAILAIALVLLIIVWRRSRRRRNK
jgi:hypothetical protein